MASNFHADDAGSWTPKLSADGEFYCSPRCGGGKFCRKEWYDRAVAEGDALAARMGEGWEPHVWENMGWYYSVKKGVVTIRVSRGNDGEHASYSAWIEPNVTIDRISLQIIAHGDTPEDALGFATQDARTVIERMREALAVLNDVAGVLPEDHHPGSPIVSARARR